MVAHPRRIVAIQQHIVNDHPGSTAQAAGSGNGHAGRHCFRWARRDSETPVAFAFDIQREDAATNALATGRASHARAADK
jgi:hypothetical protein